MRVRSDRWAATWSRYEEVHPEDRPRLMPAGELLKIAAQAGKQVSYPRIVVALADDGDLSYIIDGDEGFIFIDDGEIFEPKSSPGREEIEKWVTKALPPDPDPLTYRWEFDSEGAARAAASRWAAKMPRADLSKVERRWSPNGNCSWLIGSYYVEPSESSHYEGDKFVPRKWAVREGDGWYPGLYGGYPFGYKDGRHFWYECGRAGIAIEREVDDE